MTADEMYKIILYASSKNLQQGYVSPDDFNTIIQIAQLGFTDYLLGEFQTYQGGRPVSKVQFGMNESVRQRLTPLIQAPVPLTIDASGFSPYPADYQQMDAMYQPNMNRVRYAQQHKLYSYLNSQIDPINANPIYLIEDSGFRFYPNISYNGTAFSSASLSYVRTPRNIVWAFIPDANGLPVYDPGNSKDPEFYDIDCHEIIVRALALVGVNLQLQQVEQYSQIIKNQGQ